MEYGFARLRGDDTVVDEPLAVLAAVQWLDQNPEFSMFRHVYRDIHKHATRKNGFEAYLVFYL